MTLKTSILTLFVIGALATAAFAQQPLLSPVPVLAKDGVIPHDGGVFLSPATAELVVAYLNGQGQQQVVRFGKHDQVALLMRSSVAEAADGTYTYAYGLQNGPPARQHLHTIWIQV